MTDEAISPLRRRMIEDMTIRKFAPKTQHDYVQRVKNFAAFLGRSPDTASFEDVRRYQLHLAASGVGVPTINQTVSTLRFFFKVTLGRPEIVEHTHAVHELPLYRPQQNAPRYPSAVASRSTVHDFRRDTPLIHDLLCCRTTCRTGSIHISQFARGNQIPMAPAAKPYVPQARFPPLEAFGRQPPISPRRPSSGRHPKPFT